MYLIHFVIVIVEFDFSTTSTILFYRVSNFV